MQDSINNTIKNSKDEKRKREKMKNPISVKDRTTVKSFKSVISEVFNSSFRQDMGKINSNSLTVDRPSTNSLTPSLASIDYHRVLPSAAPLTSPLISTSEVLSGSPMTSPGVVTQVPDCNTTPETEDVIGEYSILLVKSNGVEVELVLNSLLSYTAAALNKGIKMKQLAELLLHFFGTHKLESAWKLACSLLKKKDRPQREQANYKISTT